MGRTRSGRARVDEVRSAASHWSRLAPSCHFARTYGIARLKEFKDRDFHLFYSFTRGPFSLIM